MSKEQGKSAKADLEYQYSENELGKEESIELDEASQRKASIKAALLDRFTKKKIFIGLVMFVAAMVLYKVLMAGNAPPPPPEKALASELTKAAPTVAQPVTKPVAPPVVVKKTLEISTPVVDYEPKIAELQTNVGQMKQSMEEVRSALSTLTTSMTALVERISQLEAMNVPKPIKVLVKKKVTHPGITIAYYLKAVVPGRAWLGSKSSSLLTVKVGDPLRGYGSVQSIDVDAGKVYTSSGRVIGYGPNDS